jgi:hypothetical protein
MICPAIEHQHGPSHVWLVPLTVLTRVLYSYDVRPFRHTRGQNPNMEQLLYVTASNGQPVEQQQYSSRKAWAVAEKLGQKRPNMLYQRF